MSKRIILHIGSHKTGTTILQQVLHHNRALLREHGILYPDSGKRGASHNNCAISLPRYGAFIDAALNSREIYENLRSEIDAFDGKMVILSGEAFSILLPESVKFVGHFFEKESVDVVRYLRRQDEQFESMYMQKLKKFEERWPHSKRACLKNHALLYPVMDYNESSGVWVDAFGKEQMMLRDYHALKNDDIVEDFFDAVGLEPLYPLLHRANMKSNVTPSAKAARLLSEINRLHASQEKINDLICKAIEKYSGKAGKTLLTKRQRKKIMMQYRSSNLALAEKMGDRANFLRAWYH